ncbi:MAG: chromophore lyase CpcT/CpeT [Hyphomonadaceae bacterium]|jgi:hypothetical protein|nr:chromophore lyase CpcT/CpeT [Hyphomonadaceae bacterium]
MKAALPILAVLTVLAVAPAKADPAPPAASTPAPVEAPAVPAPSAGPAPIAVPVPLQSDPSGHRRNDVLAKDLADLAIMLAGRWDNDSQAFFEPELGIPASQRRQRVHALVRPLPEAVFGKPAYLVEHRGGGERGAVLRQRVWTLSVDAARDGIRMDVLAPLPDTDLDEVWTRAEALSGLASSGFSEVGGCDILWRRRGAGFSGETRAGGCRITGATGTGSVILSERHDLSAGVWDVRDMGVDDSGQRVFGAEDGRPTRFDRAVSYTCWAGVVSAGAPPVATGLTIHDRGGEFRVGDPAEGGYRVRLRTVEWPFGNNRPSLTLYLLTAPGETAEAYAWADPGANRIAISVRAMQASCTRSADTLWD